MADTPTALPDEKICSDSVHGFITLPSICFAFIDTPQFQRLRNIKQLGASYFVYPGASHNRFEHSIGVCYLAGQLVKKLRSNQPELHIDNEDVLCVRIAGLCHDLGHGPFSHLFDKHVIPKLDPPVEPEWKHEDASVMMFNHMLSDAGGNKALIKAFKDKCEELKTTVDHVKMRIAMLIKPPENIPEDDKKKFLYEIVANQRTKIDVDKWDYFVRDCHHLGFKNGFEYQRLIECARVIDDKICYRDKEEIHLYEMFHTRHMLHRRACQHKTSLIVENMIAEALRLAISELKLPGEDGKMRTLRECIHDPVAYTLLDDTVMWLILHPRSEEEKENANLIQARDILQKIQRREHHRFICSVIIDKIPDNLDAWKEDKLGNRLREWVDLTDIVIMPARFDYGNDSEDPLVKLGLYSKQDPNKVKKRNAQEVSRMKPEIYSENCLFFYTKKDFIRSETFTKVTEEIIKYCSTTRQQ